MPAKGEKFGLKSVNVLTGSDQSVSFDNSADPYQNSVVLNDLKPVNMMKMIKKNTKMTPIEPNFMKILMSFLLQIRARTRKRKIAQ